MKKLFLIAGAGAALILSSCKKENSHTSNPSTGGTTKLLQKLTKTENNQTTVYNFSYDANKRLTGFKSTDNVESTSFTYDNGGNLTKIEQSDKDFKNIYAYSYANGVPL